MDVVLGILVGFVLWFFARYLLGGFYTIGPNERAVLCTFGRAQRLPDETTLSDPIADHGWLTAPDMGLQWADLMMVSSSSRPWRGRFSAETPITWTTAEPIWYE